MTLHQAPQIFDQRRKEAVWNRAFKHPATDKFLWQYMATDLAERLGSVQRDFRKILFIGPIGDFAAQILGSKQGECTFAAICQAERDAAKLFGIEKILIDDSQMPFDPASYNLIISAGTLDSTNDLPGSLIQLRRALVPDGLMLATLFAAGSLPALKSAMLTADGSRTMAHIHPQIELKSAADLLSRTGFALPVADLDTLSVRYSNLFTLIDDLRQNGLSNKLAGSRSFLGKEFISRLQHAWTQKSDVDGKITEQFAFIGLSGWAPSPDQPKPARRGSGKVSLADALKSPMV